MPRVARERNGATEHLIGENPLEIDRLWQKMYRGSIYYGRPGPAIHAMSGIDIALWDIKGKALGQPIQRLLGGPHRTEIRAYASTLMPETPEETAEVVADLASAASRQSSSAGDRSDAMPISMWRWCARRAKRRAKRSI